MGCDSSKTTDTSRTQQSSTGEQPNQSSQPQNNNCQENKNSSCQPQQPLGPVFLNGEFKKKSGRNEEEISYMLKDMAEVTRKEEGCMLFMVGYNEDESLCLLGKFKNMEAMACHKENPDLKDIGKLLFENFELVGPPTVLMAMPPCGEKVYAFSEYDSQVPEYFVIGKFNGNDENCKNKFFAEFAPGVVNMGKMEEGCLSLDVIAIPETNKFGMTGIWKNAEAWKAHHENPDLGKAMESLASLHDGKMEMRLFKREV